MPALKNPRHEKFSQLLAKGKSADKAYVAAGYKENRHNAAALAREKHILTRVQELQAKGAERTLVTIQSLTEELEDARKGAAEEKQFSAAVTATMGKAKLHGLLIEKKRIEGADGGPVEINLNGYSLEQLRLFQGVIAQLASASGSDAEADQGGDSEEGSAG